MTVERVDPQPIWDLIDRLKLEGEEAGYIGTDPRKGWWFRLTGTPIHGTVWETRILRARRQGWIRREYMDQIMAHAANLAALEPRPRPERGPVPRLPSAPLRPWWRGEAETVSVYEADEVCVKRIGVHPAVLYGELWWDAA